MDIIQVFKNSNPINIADLQSTRASRARDDAYFNKTGRLFGVTDEHDKYLLITASVLGGTRKVLLVADADKDTPLAVKSSTYSTGKPFINAQKLCVKWFGDNKANWDKRLRLIASTTEGDFYEVIEDRPATPTKLAHMVRHHGTYKYYKGGCYVVENLAKYHEGGGRVVLYRPLGEGNAALLAMREQDFLEKLDSKEKEAYRQNHRFELIA